MGDILSGLFGKLGLNLSGLADSVLVLGLTIFALALGFFAIRYLGKRRQTDEEARLAALIKGLHRAGIPREVFNKPKPKPDAQDHLLRGLRWLLGGAGISGAMYGYAELQPANVVTDALKGVLLGIVPSAIGIAHLIFSDLRDPLSCRRHAPAPVSYARRRQPSLLNSRHEGEYGRVQGPARRLQSNRRTGRVHRPFRTPDGQVVARKTMQRRWSATDTAEALGCRLTAPASRNNRPVRPQCWFRRDAPSAPSLLQRPRESR